ncbi:MULTISPECIES: TrbC/VirB2 family protein [Bacillus cereus group]|jgi:succinate dehydrogenase/fumarate reductase cytochrome b subunit|uniref:Uncharacterized protein n=1 Tax=Bacillus cereus TaxID=1396 RepID=A0A1Q4L590_BACCE|nr:MULTISPECIES: TrbC/VirB2 family protein [Bacillus cereus group]EJP83444.1 hypothetical protein IAU_05424 [Bacillus cereus IS075]EOO82487.1 hypothetical protein IGS_05844 [Bacillus cereus IS845/00]EOO92510.1 hypothetical protein IGQ_05717 [Bacillus cereus IS195]EHL64988.1 hypothetical protein HMPREF1014_05598 [Bacillus sp. 7_6_55CFAA_CT2]MCU5019684.1 TrbC/VirB2 family protein [Bacillus paranthracis]
MDLFTAFYIKLLTYNDFFDSVSNAMNSWTGRLQAIGLVTIVFCVCIAGFMFWMGEEMSRNAKKWLMRIVIGAIFVFGAGVVGQTIQGVTGGF